MHAKELAAAIIAVCPVVSVSVGKAHDRSTWSFKPAEDATDAQKTAGTNVIDTIEDTPDTR